jgi:hypothetical protein
LGCLQGLLGDREGVVGGLLGVRRKCRDLLDLLERLVGGVQRGDDLLYEGGRKRGLLLLVTNRVLGTRERVRHEGGRQKARDHQNREKAVSYAHPQGMGSCRLRGRF